MVDRHQEPHATGRPDSAYAPEAEAAEPCLVRLRGRKGGGRSAGRRCLNWAFGAALTVFLIVGLAAGAFLLMLSQGPIPVDALGARIAAALDARLGEPYNVSLARTVVERGEHGPAVTMTDFQVRGRSGEVIFEAPRAQVAIDSLGLLTGAVTPRRLDIFDLELKLVVTPDGAVALTAGKEQVAITPPSPAPAPSPAPSDAPGPAAAAARDHAAMRPVADALRRLLALSVGAGSPFAALERFSIQRGRLVLDDRMADRSTVFEGLEVAYEKIADSARLTVSAAGPNGRWSVTAQANGDAAAAGETPRSLDVEIDGVSVSELSLVAGWRDPPFDFDMALGARINLGLGADGALEVATGRFDVGSGYFFIKDPDHEPLRVDAMSGGFRWDATSRKFDIQPVQFRSGRTSVSFAGRLTPPEDGVGAWALSLAGGPGTLGSERPGEVDIPLRRSELTLRVDPAAREFTLDRFAIDGTGVAFALTGSGSFAERARRLSLRADAGGTQVNALLRLWPSPIAAHTRAWLLANQHRGVIQTGVMALDFDEAAFVDIHEHRPVADEAVRLEFTIAEGELTFLDGAPPLSALAGKGVVTGRTATFVASAGQMDLGAAGKLTLSEGRFDAPDFARKPLPATVMVRAAGSLDTLNELLSREALKGYGGFSIDPASVKGQVDGRVTVDLKLGGDAGPQADKPEVRVAAQISNFSVEKLLGKERLEQASLAVVADAAGMRATGQGRLLGAATRIELRKPLQGVAEATLGFTLDEAARAKQGWNFGSAISGPIGVKITAPMGLAGAAAEKNRPVVELDLTRTAIAALPPGYSKPAGRAAKASFSVASEGERTSLQNFAFEAGAASAQGAIDLDASGGFLAARMSQLRLSPGDDVRVDAQQTKDLIKVTVRGSTLDARPLIQEYLGGGIAAARGGAAAETRDLDLDLKTNLVTGNNGQTLANVELRLNRAGGRVRDFKLTGRAGRSPLSGGMLQTAGAPQFYIRSDDGGGLLSFLDLYRRMDGGQLQLVGLASGDQLNGMLTVRSFTLRNEAALRRLVAEGAGQGDASPPIDPNAAPFDRLQVAFLRSGSRLTLRDGVIHGPAIGTTLEGVIDFGRDQVALNGTFIPAYGVNNLFAKIPLFGPILGGGSNEGLFAVNFRISGSASAPLLSINPLSAIAPGFLRKIFGAADAAATPRLPEEPRSIVPTR